MTKIIQGSLFAATLAGGLFFATGEAHAGDKRCDGMDQQIAKISTAVEQACKATKAKACEEIDSPKTKDFLATVDKFVSTWNQYVANSSLKIGARMFGIGSGGSGTIQSTQRMWVSKSFSTDDSVTIRVNELDGKLHVGAHVCLLEPGKKTPVYKKSVFFNENSKTKKNKKQSKSITVNGAKGKIVMFKIAAQKPSANKFKYKFSSSTR